MLIVGLSHRDDDGGQQKAHCVASGEAGRRLRYPAPGGKSVRSVAPHPARPERSIDTVAVLERHGCLSAPHELRLGDAPGPDPRAMMLLDTNVLIYASDEKSEHYRWARRMIMEGVSGAGAAINAVTLAETCVGDAEPLTVAARIRSWGVAVLDVPAAAAEPCAHAYLKYRVRRKAESGKDAPALPLPDFFIGAHAQIMGWSLVTADESRFKTYFPAVLLRTPPV